MPDSALVINQSRHGMWCYQLGMDAKLHQLLHQQHNSLASTSTNRNWNPPERIDDAGRELYPCIICQQPTNLVKFSFKLINLLVDHGLDTRNVWRRWSHVHNTNISCISCSLQRIIATILLSQSIPPLVPLSGSTYITTWSTQNDTQGSCIFASFLP